MTTLDAKKRKQLPDSAFAYVDSTGRRRLPINDEAHVRNALARFDQVFFEDMAARDRARTRLLRAAKKYGIVPIGFVTGQLRPQGSRRLPTGVVTFMLADIESSTSLLNRLGDGYGPLLVEVRRLIRRTVRRVGGHEVDAHGDEYFAVFQHASDAIEAALSVHRLLATRDWADEVDVRVRIGVHSGRPTPTDSGYVGMAVHAVARISALARGGQSVVSRAAIAALGPTPSVGVRFESIGPHKLRGVPGREVLYLVSPTGD